MRMPWQRSSDQQLTLLGIPVPEPTSPAGTAPAIAKLPARNGVPKVVERSASASHPSHGEPLRVPIERVFENPNNPRTEFPPDRIDLLAQDILCRGILQPIVVAPADSQDRHIIRMGAMRWRAARQAGLAEVPVVIEPRALRAYDLLAENLKRTDLSPLNLAQALQELVNEGESNASIASELGMDPTTVAHHLALLTLPPVLRQALNAGRCTAPRTLYELGKLHEVHPERVADFVGGGQAITRDSVAALRDQLEAAAPVLDTGPRPRASQSDRSAQWLRQTQALCDRLDRAVARLARVAPNSRPAAELAALRERLAALAERLV
jgi:ParB family transcriptional regulator, chromosome partitioning protein